MAGFSASAAILSGFRMIGRHPGVVLAWGVAYVAVALVPLIALFWGELPTLLGLYARMMQGLIAGAPPTVNDPEMMRLQGLLVAFEATQAGLNLLAVALVSSAVYRAVLEPERKAFAYLRVGLQELWVGLSLLALYLLLIFVAFTGALTVGLLAQGLGAGSWGGGLIVFLAGCGMVALVIWLALRLSLAAPMSFAGRRFELSRAWPLTEGQGWRLFGLALALVSVILLVQMVLATVGDVLGMGAALTKIDDLKAFLANPTANPARMAPAVLGLGVLQVLVSALSFTLWTTPFAELYREQSKPGVVAKTEA